MRLRLLYQDECLVLVDKPAGIAVHRLENETHRVGKTCLQILRGQLGQYVYPAHRLDRATAGVLVFTLDEKSASHVQQQFQSRSVRKNYFCLARGWIPGDCTIDSPLKNTDGELQPARTEIKVLQHLELPLASGRYEKTRYTLLEAHPETGRYHQIRRHLDSVAHPILGDSQHGDKKLNRIFSEFIGSKRLFLHAHSIHLSHPRSGDALSVRSRWPHDWHKVFDLFGYCPLD